MNTPAPRTTTRPVLESTTSTAEPGAAMRLLHVEDNASDALLTQEYISGVVPGVVFDTAVRLGDLTPERAAAADCAILDLSLPDATGLQALIAVRAMSEQLPIIVLTGFDDLDLAVAALGHGADDYLIKNYADGYTLQRAIRYAIERRRLRLELARETAANTAATTATFAAEAALDVELLSRGFDTPQGVGVRAVSPVVAALGTHEVAVRIDEETGDYALRCQTCTWESAQVEDDGHSWADRALDWVLLYHVDFGGLGHDTEGKLPTTVRTALAAARAEAARARAEKTAPVARRGMFSMRGLLQPSKPAVVRPAIPGMARLDDEIPTDDRLQPHPSVDEARRAHPSAQRPGTLGTSDDGDPA